VKLSQKVEGEFTPEFTLKEGVLRFRGRLCVPKIDKLREELLKESHEFYIFNPSRKYEDVS